MMYDNLSSLIRQSSSTRKYFLSLPIKTQCLLHSMSDSIHTAEGLHQAAAAAEKTQRLIELSGRKSDI